MPHSVDEHQEKLMDAFARVLSAEESIRVRKVELQETSDRLGMDIRLAEGELTEAWQAISSLLADTGEFEVVLPGSATDYKIGWSTPRTVVKVDSPDAVPDQFVKIERKPMLKEIGDHLRALADAGTAMPNWACLDIGGRKLRWTAVKKGKAA